MTKPSQGSGSGSRMPREKSTPATDMQAEDAGTADSGKDTMHTERSRGSDTAMKQEHKTGAERGDRGDRGE